MGKKSRAARHKTQKGKRFLVLLSLGALAGCKGGGVGTAGSTLPSGFLPNYNYGGSWAAAPTPVNASVMLASFAQNLSTFDNAVQNLLTNDTRYTRQAGFWHFNGGAQNYYSNPLKSSGVAYAHAAGLTGAGSLVSVVDAYINPNHVAITGKGSVSSNGNPLNLQTGEFDHGTQVTSIIVGSAAANPPNDSGFIGMAPGATFTFASYYDVPSMIMMTLGAKANHAVAQNNSWGFQGSSVTQTSYNNQFSTTNEQNYIAALKAYAQQGVVVFAISNDSSLSHSTLMEGLPVLDPTLESGWIAVGNATYLDQAMTQVQILSSGCYEAARWCILADGTWEAAAGDPADNTYQFGTGTSFAAPQVSGALALLEEAFQGQGLSPHDLRLRLLATADNSFFTPDGTVELATGYNKSYSYVYGLGMLDVKAALEPIGISQVRMADGSAHRIDQPMIATGSAMGDAVIRSLRTVDVGFTDSFNAGFTMSGDHLAASSAPAPLDRTLLTQSLATNLAATRVGTPSTFDHPFEGLAGQTYAMNNPTGDLGAAVLLPNGSGSAGINLKQTLLDGPTKLELGLKLAHDSGGLLGFGAGGNSGSNLASLTLGMTQDLGDGGYFSVSGEFGRADLGSQPNITNLTSAGFNAAHVDLGQRDVFSDGDRLALGIGLPVAVTSGSGQIVLPVADGVGNRTSYQPVGLDLSPSSRQQDISLTYQTELADGMEMLMSLVHAENFGNQAGETDNAGVLALKISF